MIWSPGRNYLFIHIPKTGGTALALALEARAMKDDVMLGDTPKALKRRRRLKGVQTAGRLWKHSTLADLDGLIGPAELEGCFVFTLVRNPWDRMVSYYHWLQGQNFDHPAVRLAQSLPFRDFVLAPVTQAAWMASNAESYVTDRAGVDQCRLYVRLEHFAEDALPLFDHLGFPLTLDRVNASARGADYRSYYDDETRKAVEQGAARDIARFSYRFE